VSVNVTGRSCGGQAAARSLVLSSGTSKDVLVIRFSVEIADGSSPLASGLDELRPVTGAEPRGEKER
jgi:hypothetical protein